MCGVEIDDGARPRDDEREVAPALRIAPRDLVAIEAPMRLRPHEADEVVVEERPIEPDMHRDDRRADEALDRTEGRYVAPYRQRQQRKETLRRYRAHIC